MSEWKRYKVTYSQEFNGEVLTDSYTRTVRSERDLFEIERALYSDPHVFAVDFEEMKEEDEYNGQ